MGDREDDGNKGDSFPVTLSRSTPTRTVEELKLLYSRGEVNTFSPVEWKMLVEATRIEKGTL